MKNSTKTILLLSLLTTIFQINAQNWTGNVNSNWNNPANWSSAPSDGSNPVINPANYTGAMASPVVSANSSFTPATLTVQNGGLLTLNANLETEEDAEVVGSGSLIHITGGTFSVGPGNGGRFTADLSGAITVDGGTLHVDQRLISGSASLITINNGIVTTDERLLLDLGGKIVQNGGTVNVAETFALADGEGAISCLYEMNGGTLNVTGEMALENEAGDFSPAFDMSGGTLNLNGDLFWFGEAPGTGTPKVHISGGTANITGTISNLAGSTVNMHLRVTDNGTLNFSGSSIDLIQSTDSIIQSGMNASIRFTNTNSWNNAGIFWAENTVTHFDGITTLNGSGSFRFNSVMIHPARTLTHSSPVTISVSGDFDQDGNFVSNTNTVHFNGSTEQFISGDQSVNFSTLNLENSSSQGLTLQIPVHIFSSLDFVSGKINSDGNNLLVVEDNASVSGSSPVSFVNGPVQKNGNDAFVFPIGKNNTWGRLGISGSSSTANSFTAEYFDQAYPGVSTVNSPLTAVSPLEYWTLDNGNSTDQVQVALHWEDAAASGITNCDEVSIASHDGSGWYNVLATAGGDCTGNGSGFLNSNAAQNQYIAFTFGFLGDVTSVDTTICAGQSYTVGQNTYTASGTYLDVLTSSQNTDSTVVTHLTVLDPIFSVNTVVLCFGDSVLVGGQYYHDAGSYPEFFTAVTGCDSLVTTNVAILPEINVNVLPLGATLTAENTGADGYQWIDCSNSQPVSNATSISFAPLENGNYAVIITSGECSDTSACYTVNSVGLPALENNTAAFFVYPNPSNGNFRLVFKESGYQLQITDIQGKIILTRKNCPAEMELNLAQNGVYFLEVQSGEGRFVEKISVR
ncbi:MAG: T9SS type A sorting domain-containing protein [Bacteroidota bacterium]